VFFVLFVVIYPAGNGITELGGAEEEQTA